jgi:hypothetical protein
MRPAPERDAQLVAAAMNEIAQVPRDAGSLADPHFIWWKAQLLRRIDAERKASTPLEIGERMHIGGAVLGAVALGAGAWSFVPSASSTSIVGLVAVIGAVVLASAITFAAWDDTRNPRH